MLWVLYVAGASLGLAAGGAAVYFVMRSLRVSRLLKRERPIVIDINLGEAQRGRLTGKEEEQEEEEEGAKCRTIRFLSHNVFAHYFVPAPYRKSRLGGLANKIREEKYDIVAVQELFGLSCGPLGYQGEAKFFASALSSCGLRYSTRIWDSRKCCGQTSGLMIYSRFPIIYSQFHAFRTTTERLNRKGVLAVLLDVGSAPVMVFNTHFDSRKLYVKEAQINEVRAFLGEFRVNVDELLTRRIRTSPSQSSKANLPLLSSAQEEDVVVPDGLKNVKYVPTIICGDFNMCPASWISATFDRLARALEPLEDALERPARNAEVVATHMKGGVLDHVFVGELSTAMKSRTSKDRTRATQLRLINIWTPNKNVYVSDHSGVEVIIRLPASHSFSV